MAAFLLGEPGFARLWYHAGNHVCASDQGVYVRDVNFILNKGLGGLILRVSYQLFSLNGSVIFDVHSTWRTTISPDSCVHMGCLLKRHGSEKEPCYVTATVPPRWHSFLCTETWQQKYNKKIKNTICATSWKHCSRLHLDNICKGTVINYPSVGIGSGKVDANGSG